MKKLTQKIASLVAAFLMGIGLVAPALTATPAYATSPNTTFGDAAILKTCWSRGENSQNGDGIICVVELVVDILSIVVGVAGVIGIVIVGIQYLTSTGNEEKTRKAKRRLFEIIIGVAAYAVGYAVLKWLLPTFG